MDVIFLDELEAAALCMGEEVAQVVDLLDKSGSLQLEYPSQTSQAHFQIAGGQARQRLRITAMGTNGSFIMWTRGHGLEIALEGFSKGGKAKAIASVPPRRTQFQTARISGPGEEQGKERRSWRGAY